MHACHVNVLGAQNAACRQARGGDRHFDRVIYLAREAHIDWFHGITGNRKHCSEPTGTGVVAEVGHHWPWI